MNHHATTDTDLTTLHNRLEQMEDRLAQHSKHVSDLCRETKASSPLARFLSRRDH